MRLSFISNIALIDYTDFIQNAEPQQNTYVNLVVECFAGEATLCGWGSGGIRNNPQDFFGSFLVIRKNIKILHLELTCFI